MSDLSQTLDDFVRLPDGDYHIRRPLFAVSVIITKKRRWFSTFKTYQVRLQYLDPKLDTWTWSDFDDAEEAGEFRDAVIAAWFKPAPAAETPPTVD